MATQSIADLVQVPEGERDNDWLTNTLGAAIELEFATLPVYLSGMWSIKEQSGEVYNLINSVVLEEMLHMALACNMLVAVGGTVSITAPTYPTLGLPGGVLPELEVYLAGLSPTTLQMYMNIEQPEQSFDNLDPQPDDPPTIGQFYDELWSTFSSLQPALDTSGQVTTGLSVSDPDQPDNPNAQSIVERLTTIGTLDQVQAAINLIKDQGEGTATSPAAPQFDPTDPVFGGEIAHYYRFAEIFHGQKLVQAGGGWEFAGDPIELPDCYPVAPVPPGGYPHQPDVQKFDAAFASLIDQLNAAWSGKGSIDDAIGTMETLYSNYASTIVSTPIEGGSGNYGPDFNPSNASKGAST